MKGVRLLVALAGLAVGLAGCAGTPRAATVPGAAEGAGEVPADFVPVELGGFSSKEEDVSKLEEQAGDKSYLASTCLWSLREGDRLRATLQVGRFVADAGATSGADVDREEQEFRLRIVSQIGQSEPRLRVLGGREVYATVANSQPVYVWFSGRYLHILSVDSKLAAPRILLREALDLDGRA